MARISSFTGLAAVAALSASATCEAQDRSVTHADPAGMSFTAQVCGNDGAQAEDRIRACSTIIKSGGLSKRDLANMYIYRARARRLAHQTDDVTRDLDLAVKSDDRYSVAYFERANFRAETGDSALALEDYDRAIKLKATYPEFFVNRGNLHRFLGHTDAAIEDYGKAIAIDPAKAVGYSNRGGLYLGACPSNSRLLRPSPDASSALDSMRVSRTKMRDTTSRALGIIRARG